jgi:hypothetical protein
MKNTLNAWAIPYRRFSSKKQADGTSEIRQESGFDSWLKRSQLEIAPSEYQYWDRGESAYKNDGTKRGAFARLLSDCARKSATREELAAVLRLLRVRLRQRAKEIKSRCADRDIPSE